MLKCLFVVALVGFLEVLGVLVHVNLYIEIGACAAAFLDAVVYKVVVELGLIRAVGCLQVGIAVCVIFRIKNIGLDVRSDGHSAVCTGHRESENIHAVIGNVVCGGEPAEPLTDIIGCQVIPRSGGIHFVGDAPQGGIGID